MRAVIQRVKKAKVVIDDEEFSSIGEGYVVLLGIGSDTITDCSYIIDKILNVRIFPDEEGKINHSLQELGHELLIVSQFTLYGDARKGRRPSFSDAAKPDAAKDIYDLFLEKLAQQYDEKKIKTGKFQAMMDVELTNSGPVTILLDSKKQF